MVFTNVINPRCEIVRRSEYQTTLIRKGATLGANSTIVCGIEIGRYAFVAAGAVVPKDIPAYALVVGVPARRIGWACRCGETLPQADTQGTTTCHACGNQYREEQETLIPIQETQDHD